MAKAGHADAPGLGYEMAVCGRQACLAVGYGVILVSRGICIIEQCIRDMLESGDQYCWLAVIREPHVNSALKDSLNGV